MDWVILQQNQRLDILFILLDHKRKFVLSLHNNRSNIFLYANRAKIYKFKAKDSEKKNITIVFG